ncbi:MFS transporter, partial [Psychroserpens sp.]
QVSEVLFILTIPFFLKRFGIKTVMILSMIAWFLRFGLFGIGSPEGIGVGYLVMSMIVYGAAFDFFNISGSLFIETETDSKYRSSAQGLFILLTNGVGAWIGAKASGLVVDSFTTDSGSDWYSIWMVFAGYALVLAILFWIIFKYKHNPDKIGKVSH